MSRTSVVVTGAAGYVGSVLCQHLLRRGYKVLGVDSFIHNNQRAMFHLLGDRRFSLLQHDVRDVAGLKPFVRHADAVVPLAAVVGAPACDRNPEFATQVNYEAVRGLVRSLSANQMVVYPNTNSGYGQTDGESFVTEADPLLPVSHYGKTKVEAEKAVLDHPRGIALRLATVFGPSPRMRFDLLVNDFTRRLCQDRQLEVFEPHFKRNFVHVRDVARAFEFGLEDPDGGRVFNVGLPDANLSKLELAYVVAGTLGMYPPSVVSVGEGEDPDKRNYLVSSDRLLLSGFEFRHTLSDGIQDVAGMLSLLTPDEAARMRNV